MTTTDFPAMRRGYSGAPSGSVGPCSPDASASDAAAAAGLNASASDMIADLPRVPAMWRRCTPSTSVNDIVADGAGPRSSVPAVTHGRPLRLRYQAVIVSTSLAATYAMFVPKTA